MTTIDDRAAKVHRFAALSGPFDPKDALAAGGYGTSRTDSIDVASSLSRICDTDAGEGSQWLIRGSERRWLIDKLREEDRLTEALDWRASVPPLDAETRGLLSALRGTGTMSPSAVRAEINDGSGAVVDRRDRLEDIAVTLEWAGPAAPAYSIIDTLRAAISRLDDRLRSDVILSQGFRGREEQQKILRDWIAAPMSSAPVLALFATGMPGIGKSALLEVAVREATGAGRPMIVVRLDFDRPTLDVLDQVGLTLEIARQIAAQLPNEATQLRELRLKASTSPGETLKGRGRESVPVELVTAIASAISVSQSVVVFVLDTCEVLRGRGETHPRRLFDWLDSLLTMGLKPMTVVAAGRGDAFDSVSGRIGKRLDVEELTEDAANRLLSDAAVPGTAWARAHRIAKGNPLLLKLAGEALKASPSAEIEAGASGGLAAAHLYRFLLSRIPDPILRRIADPGLVVRRINFEIMRDVLGPLAGFSAIGDTEAKRLVDELETQNWLVERDALAPGWLRQRPAMRSQLLPLLHAVRRQGFWDNRRRELTEALVHQVCHIRPLHLDEASGAV